MKQLTTLFLLLFFTYSIAQIPSYYNDVNLNLSGSSLLSELADKVTTSQTTTLSYTPGVWDALKQTDLVPGDNSKVILVYGYNDSDGVTNTDRTRGIDDNGGGSTDWNREHVYPKSLGQPNLGTSGPGADAHHLRPSDVSRNSSRGNRKFADGSGNSAITAQGYWYPGDEFKGDVARMIMYMYIRYGNRCLPSNVGIGSPSSSDANMLDLFLEWNAEDPVSALELQRNPILENLQGNRNPFIDNPAFATEIWGGPQAEDLFGGNPVGNTCTQTVSSFAYAESFESNIGQWAQSTSDDFDWTRKSGSTPSTGTGPSAADIGSYYIYMESSSPNYSSKRAIITSPCFDLSQETQAEFSFSYHMLGASNMGSLVLELSTDGNNWSSIWSKSGNQGATWLDASINLDAYAGETIQLRFNGVTGTTWKGDMALDGLTLTTESTGGGSDIATNLRITFDNYPEETSWEIRNSSNVAVASGGLYGGQADGSTINISVSLPAGCYSLIFSDTYGDGICCSYGSGSYALSNSSSGAILASGGSFGSTDTNNFCVGGSALEIDNEDNSGQSDLHLSSIKVFPNPVLETINLSGVNNGLYQVYNLNGQLIMKGDISSQINVSSLLPGNYFIRILGSEQNVTKAFIKD